MAFLNKYSFGQISGLIEKHIQKSRQGPVFATAKIFVSFNQVTLYSHLCSMCMNACMCVCCVVT